MSVILTHLGNAFSAGGWIATILIGMIVVWKASAKYTHIKGQVDAIPDMKSDISHMKSDISYMKSDISYMKSDIIDIKSAIKSKPDPLPTASQSPITLTDYGREISQAIKADELAEKYAHKVVFSEDSNAYEIQEACRFYALMELMDDLAKDEKERIEHFAYEKGKPIEFPLRVIWIKMRDYWLEKKGISTGDVDNHAPEDA